MNPFRTGAALALSALLALAAGPAAAAEPAAPMKPSWEQGPPQPSDDFPRTDFTKFSHPPESVPKVTPRDYVIPIDEPKFVPVGERSGAIAGDEPVLTVEWNGEARAYALRVLTMHEALNDSIGGRPVLVTYSPLTDTTAVYDRRLPDGRVLDFGVSGRMLYSNTVLYDRQTESWWRQWDGLAFVGELTGARLERLPARRESVIRFAEAHPDGLYLVPTDRFAMPYGRSVHPYYDTGHGPFSFYEGPRHGDALNPVARVVAVDGEAWTLALLRERGEIETDSLVLRWEPGQASPLDNLFLAQGRDIGNVTVWRKAGGGLEPAIYDMPFSFAFRAFHPEAAIHMAADQAKIGAR